MKRFIFLGLFIASLGSVLFSNNAFALTDFERSLKFTDKIYVSEGNGRKPVDITDNWRTLIVEGCNKSNNSVVVEDKESLCNDFIKSLNDVFSKGSGDYLIFQYVQNSGFNYPVDPNFSYRYSFGTQLFFTSGVITPSVSTSLGANVYSTIFESKTPMYTASFERTYGKIYVYLGFNKYTTFNYATVNSQTSTSYAYKPAIFSARISNIQHSSDYSGTKISDTTIKPESNSGYEKFTSSIFEEFRDCQAFDLGCLVENFLIFIRNVFTFITKLPEFIVEIFKFLFVPDQEFLATYFEDMKAYAVDNSGLLKIPVTVFNSFMKMIRDVVGNSGNSAENLIIHLNYMLGGGFNCSHHDSDYPYLDSRVPCSGTLTSFQFFGEEFQINQSIYPIIDKFLVYIRIFLQGSLALMLIGLFYKRIQIYAGRAF